MLTSTTSTEFRLMSSMEQITGRQCRAGRALIGWSQADLAKEAAVFPRTVADFETGRREPTRGTKKSLAIALAVAGVALLESEGVAVRDTAA